MQEIIYNYKSDLSNRRQLLIQIYFDLKSSKQIGWQLFRRNFISQYRQNFLGYIWIFLPSLATAMIWIFLHLSKIIDLGITQIPYPIYVLIGVFLWQTFVEAVNCPLQQLSFSRQLISKFKIPHEALFIAGLGGVVFNLLVRLIILLVCLIFFQVSISWSLLLAPIGLATLILMGVSIGLFFTPLGMLYKDILNGIGIILNLLFFLTPIIYPIPEKGLVLQVVSLNPLTSVINTNRNWLTGKEIAIDFSFFMVAILSIIVFIFSWFFYRLAKPYIIEKISS